MKKKNVLIYKAGTMVTLSIKPPDIFLHWSGDIEGEENPIAFVVDSDKEIKVYFSGPIQEAINAASPGDTIVIPPGLYTKHMVLKPGIVLICSGSTTTSLNGGSFGSTTIADASTISWFAIYGGTERISCISSNNSFPAIY